MYVTPEALVARVFGREPSEIGESSSPETLSEWDSLGHVTLIIELESAYGVSFSPEETMTMTSVGAIKRTLGTRGVQW